MKNKVVSIDRKSSKPDDNSPVGMLLVRVLAKNPDVPPEEARLEAHRLLRIAAGRKKYVIPPVLSLAEKAERNAKILAAFGTREKSKHAA